MENRLMCNNKLEARRNRERVKSTEHDAFYAKQAKILAQWKLGEPAPARLILDELPCVGGVGKTYQDED